jgi:hypothetical protein
MVGNSGSNPAERGLRVVKATVGLLSNDPGLITAPEYFGGIPHPVVARGRGWQIRAQEANVRIEEIPYAPPPALDGYFEIVDRPGERPRLDLTPDRVTATGDWTALEEGALDRRYTLLGNQGVFFRYLLTVLERRGVYNFHACGLLEQATGRVCLVLGERGSGKSALLLAALASGRFLAFGTEIVHAGFEEGGFVFYRGSLRNNVRLGHLLHDFPALLEPLEVAFHEVSTPWSTKVQLDFSAFAVPQDVLVDPELTIVIPRIEERLESPQIEPVPEGEWVRIKRGLVENLGDKIGSMALAYETLPIGTLDRPELLAARIGFVDRLLSTARIRRTVNLFASPLNCLEGLMP